MKHRTRLQALIASMIVLAVILGLPAPLLYSSSSKTGGSVIVYIPAVEEVGAGEKGTLVATLVSVSPGSGNVKVSSGGNVGSTTRSSIVQAAAIASILAGVDWRSYDFKVDFLNASDVSGPSGSAYITLIFYSLITGSPILEMLNKTTMTGAITPVGLFGPVGGVEYKCHAAMDAGLKFYYPLANVNSKIISECPNGTPVAGLYGSVSKMLGIKTTGAEKPVTVGLPEAFLRGMVNASENMSQEAVEVLSSLPADKLGGSALTFYKEAWKNINMSRTLLNKSPYASASYAFTALIQAYTAYYYYQVSNMSVGKGLTSYILEQANMIRGELQSLLDSMEEMPDNGSIYYVEFLGTAFSRTADALSSLQDLSLLAGYSPYDAISTLAYARARIASIESWLEVAQALREAPPVMSSAEVENLTLMLGDYAHISSSYSISLAEYTVSIINNIEKKKLLENYISILQGLISKGDSYQANGYYIAALGFYREAISRSMDDLFIIMPQNNTTLYNMTIDGYLNESVNIYNTLILQLEARGFPPGLAPAYMNYSEILYSNGDKQDALGTAMEALASTIEWYLYALQKQMSPQGGQGMPQAGPGQILPEMPGYGYLPLVIAGLAGLIVGLLIAYRWAVELVRNSLEGSSP
ncbi:MAG: hypothetical protein LRS48_04235 [Desulfurococcales archaeon]|nr:hypothetical protein [Desulfurococcales archaeon]